MKWLPIMISQQTVLAFVVTTGLLAIAMIAELAIPRRTLTGNLSWRWTNNFSLALVTWGVSTLVMHWFYLLLAAWTSIEEYGLLRHLEVGFWPSFLTLFLVAQFLHWATHVAFHRIDWLWPIHAVHHSDIDVDATTTYRHHPLEPLVFLPLVGPVIALLGVPVEAVLAYQLTLIAETIFQHSNIYLPQRCDRWLRKVVVTPDFHRLHHHSDPAFTNSNYGVILPWFDYLFGTASDCDFERHADMELGLEYAREPRASRLDQMIFRLPRALGPEHSGS